jgi:soluble lytic murein transglycosylase-like protein
VCTIFLKVILDRTSDPCRIAIGTLIVLFLAPFSVRAEVYTYLDENDTVHYTNVPTDPLFKMIIRPKEEKPKAVSTASEKDQRGQKEFGRLIEAKSYQYGLDPALVKAVIAVESEFNPRAVSEKGARGLMQLMPMTADELGVTNPFDPEANIDGGTRYLKYLLDYFNWDIDLALAAYHAGMMRVVRHTGIPPIPATHQYVKKVKKVYQKYILQ